MAKLLSLPLTPPMRARTYALAKSADQLVASSVRDEFMAEVSTSWLLGYEQERAKGVAQGAAQIRDEVAAITSHPAFGSAEKLALDLYFRLGDAEFVLGVLDGVGNSCRYFSQDIAPALWMRENGYPPREIGEAIANA